MNIFKRTNYISEKIRDVEYVSFDVFDTLLKRNVLHPTDVYELVELIYEKRTGKKIECFKERRYNAELISWKCTCRGGFSLDEIYRLLEEEYDNETILKLKNIECQVEKVVIQVNYEMLSLWNYAIKTKKVILTSDMYLPSGFIKRVLEDINIKGYEKLYISGEQNYSKADGGLFRYIKNKYGKLVHVGDSFRDDYIEAYRAGISSILIKSKSKTKLNKKFISSLQDNIAYNLSNNNCFRFDDYWHRIGFQIWGPLLLAMTQWIKEEINKNGIKKVVFLARDGYLIKEITDLLFEEVDSEYFFVSRKSALVPVYCDKKNIESVLAINKFRKRETLKSVLNRLGIEDVFVENIEVNRKDIRAGFYTDFLSDYHECIMTNSREQRETIVEYCKEVFTEEKCAIVDLGWNGTIQDSLQYICRKAGINSKLYGLYLGLEGEQDGKKAFLSKKDGFDSNGIPYTRGIFETFFTAPHPTVDKYIKDGSGNVKIKFCSHNVDEKTDECVKSMHEGAISYVKEYMNIVKQLGIDDLSISNRFAASGVQKLACMPSKEDVKMFGQLHFYDTDAHPLIAHSTMKTIMSNFIDSDWKVGFLREKLRLNIPYYYILVILNRFRKK